MDIREIRYNIHQLTKLLEYLLNGEPVFIIRAQDKAAVHAVGDYIERSKAVGGTNLIRSEAHLQRIAMWQRSNTSKLKAAD